MIATALIVLSGFILYSDKAMSVINFQFDLPAKFAEVGMDFATYIWLMSQTVSPVLIIMGAMLRPYKIAYAVPLYCYILQMYFIFLDYKIIDNDYLQLYTFGTLVIVLGVVFSIKKLAENLFLKQIAKAKQKIADDVQKAKVQ